MLQRQLQTVGDDRCTTGIGVWLQNQLCLQRKCYTLTWRDKEMVFYFGIKGLSLEKTKKLILSRWMHIFYFIFGWNISITWCIDHNIQFWKMECYCIFCWWNKSPQRWETCVDDYNIFIIYNFCQWETGKVTILSYTVQACLPHQADLPLYQIKISPN